MDANEKIALIISPSLEDMGFEVVRIRLSGSKQMTLQIMVDRKDEFPISVDDCAEISYVVSTLLDVEDPIKDAYSLEVSSPGIDRPLTRLKDFDKWQGFEVRIQLKWLINGRRRFRGTLLGIEGDQVKIKDEKDAIFECGFDQIDEAKLILNDHLLKVSRDRAIELGIFDGVEGGLVGVDQGEEDDKA